MEEQATMVVSIQRVPPVWQHAALHRISMSCSQFRIISMVWLVDRRSYNGIPDPRSQYLYYVVKSWSLEHPCLCSRSVHHRGRQPDSPERREGLNNIRECVAHSQYIILPVVGIVEGCEAIAGGFYEPAAHGRRAASNVGATARKGSPAQFCH